MGVVVVSNTWHMQRAGHDAAQAWLCSRLERAGPVTNGGKRNKPALCAIEGTASPCVPSLCPPLKQMDNTMWHQPGDRCLGAEEPDLPVARDRATLGDTIEFSPFHLTVQDWMLLSK